MASGRLLREPVTIVEKRRRRRLTATVRSELSEVAEIRVRWVKSAVFPGYPVADGEVAYPDGEGWTIAVEAPDRPPDPPKLLGGLRRGRYPIWERVIRVRDRRDVVLAEATFPDAYGERLEQRKSENRRARMEVRREMAAAGGDTVRAAGSRWTRSHRRGRLKWLLAGAVSMFIATGFLPAAIVTMVTGETGLGLAFTTVATVSSWLGVLALRRWRDPMRCWACGAAIADGPDMCPACGVAEPASAGFGVSVRGLRRAPSSAFEWLRLAAGRMTLLDTNPTLVVDGTSEILRPEHAGFGRRARFQFGSLRIERRRRRTELFPDGPVAIEAALLAWLVITGDVIFPKDVGGGG